MDRINKYENNIITLKGNFRVRADQQYDDLNSFFNETQSKINPNEDLFIDMTEVEYVNSTAISLITIFVQKIGEIYPNQKLIIKGEEKNKFIKRIAVGNFPNFHPNLEFIWE